MKSIDFSVKNHIYPTLNRTLAGWLLVAAVLVFSPVQAVEVTALYQGVVTVATRDNVREREQAFGDAMRQVLLKVTGNSNISSQPVIRRALVNAADYVDTWSYRTVSAVESTPNAANGGGIELSVTFFEPEILSLLETASMPIWPRNRPYTLVWLVVQDELGARQLISSSSRNNQDIRQLLETGALRRGLPVLMPLLDFEDLRAISANDVWDLDAEKLLAASTRYQSESILVVRMFKTLAGDVLGKSHYLFRGQVFELELYEESSANFIEQSIALAADELSAYYAVLLSGTDSSMEVNLTVEGITTAEDYAGLLNYVGQLTDVNTYRIARVKGQMVELKLATGGQLRQLVETIALSRNLKPSSELLRDDNQIYLSYQWQQ